MGKNTQKLFKLIAIIIIIVQAASCASTPDGFDAHGIPGVIKDFSKKHKHLRIAVLDFINTADKKTKYDRYIADRLVSELSRHGFTLLERKQLKLLLKEQTLSLKGVISSNEALKMGKLLPVDVIVTGSYTMLGSRIEINGKFIHVVSGKIIHAFSTYQRRSGQRNGNDPWDKNNDKDGSGNIGCQVDAGAVETALKHLKTKSEIQHAAEEAAKIPFDEQCGKIHYRVMSTFRRYKVFPRIYRNFLTDTIVSIKYPKLYRRTLAIMRYFAADHKVDTTEWNAMVAAFRKVKKYSVHVYMYSMLNSKYESDSDLRKRTNQLMNLASSGKIGQPVPAEDWRVFFSILNILRRQNRDDLTIANQFYKKYKDVIPSERRYIKKTIKILTSMYWKARSSKNRKEIFNSIVSFSKKHNDSPEIIKNVWFFGKDLDRKINDRNTGYRIKSLYTRDIRKFNKSLRPILCSAVQQFESRRFRYRVKESKIYLLKYNVNCGNTLSIKTLMADLRSRDINKKYEASKILSKAGMGAKGAERLAIRYLDYVGHGYKGKLIRQNCALILGNIKTRNPRAIRALVELLQDINLSYHARLALKNIGKPAIPYVIKGLYHRKRRIRYSCVQLLGEMGRDARRALGALQRIAASDRDYSVRRRAKMSIKMIKNDF